MTKPHYHVFLGGQDLEMTAIATLARAALGPAAVSDKALGWGAAASAYASEIAAAAARGVTPVLVELHPDMPLPAGSVLVDHHGARAGEPTSLEQVFALLRLPAAAWTRDFALIAANDRGHVAGLRAMGASAQEIARIRAADRRAQGITLEEEAAGRAALAAAERRPDGLIVARLPHGRAATLTDPLAESGAADSELLALMPGEVAFFGTGARVAALDAAFPGGWSGGELPRRGFWGCHFDGAVDAAPLLAALEAGASAVSEQSCISTYPSKIE